MADDQYKAVSKKPIGFFKLPPNPTDKDVDEAAQAMLAAVQQVVKEGDQKEGRRREAGGETRRAAATP